MNQNLTDVTILLDRSGSMVSCRADMEGGFKTFLDEQRKLPGECRLTLVQFDSEGIDTVYENMLVQFAPDMTLIPRGGTPLLQALGRTIENTGKRLAALPEAERPARVVMIVITDGEENSSHGYTKEQIRAMVTHQETVYNWKFVYLGANVDAFREGASMGFAFGSTSGYDVKHAKAAFGAVSRGLTGYRSGSSTGVVFTEEDRSDMAGST